MCRHPPNGSYAPGYHYVQTPTIIIHMLVLFFCTCMSYCSWYVLL